MEDCTEVSLGTSGGDSWNYTLPNPRKRPDRPKTLTPPPRLPGANQNPFKNQDWRLYVRGDFEFKPIQNGKECDAIWSGVKKVDDGYNNHTVYAKPKPRNPHVYCVQTENQFVGGYPHSAQNRLYGAKPARKLSQLDVNLASAVKTTNFGHDQTKRLNIKPNSWQVFNKPKMSDTTESKEPIFTKAQAGSKTVCSVDKKETQLVQTENVVAHVTPVLSPTIERKNMSVLLPPTQEQSSYSTKKDVNQAMSEHPACKNIVDVSKINQRSNSNNVQSTSVLSTGSSKQNASHAMDKSDLPAIGNRDQVDPTQVDEKPALKNQDKNAEVHVTVVKELDVPSYLQSKSSPAKTEKLVSISVVHPNLKLIVDTSCSGIPEQQIKDKLSKVNESSHLESSNLKKKELISSREEAKPLRQESPNLKKEEVTSSIQEVTSSIQEVTSTQEVTSSTHEMTSSTHEVTSSTQDVTSSQEYQNLNKEEEMSSRQEVALSTQKSRKVKNQEVTSSMGEGTPSTQQSVPSTDTTSPKALRLCRPDIAIPPPPCLEKQDKHTKSEEGPRSPEKKSRKHRSRSRSNSGGEVELRRASQEKGNTRKVTQATQTEQRRKSDPGFISRGRQRIRKLPDLLEQTGTSDQQLDSDNNNIINTDLSWNYRNSKENHVPSRNSDHIDENRNGGSKCHGTWVKEQVEAKKDLPNETGRRTLVPVTNTSKETQCDFKGDQFSGPQKSDKDITVQVEVYVSCKERDRGISDPRSRGYTDNSSRTWQRERRVSAKPLMPVIAEIQKGTDDDTDGDEVFDSSTCSSTRSRKGHSRSLSSSSTTTSTSEGQNSPDPTAPPLPPRRNRRKTKLPVLIIKPPEPPHVPVQSGAVVLRSGGMGHLPHGTGVPVLGCAAVQKVLTPPSSPPPMFPSFSTPSSGSGSSGSLLDSMHRKYYPNLYKERFGLHSSEVIHSRHSNPEVCANKEDVAAVPHSKSASFAQGKVAHRSTPERLSDSAVHTKVDALNLQDDASSSIGSLQHSPCSTLSPPTLRKARTQESSEGESSYGSMSSAKGMELRPCSDGCPAALEDEVGLKFKLFLDK